MAITKMKKEKIQIIFEGEVSKETAENLIKVNRESMIYKKQKALNYGEVIISPVKGWKVKVRKVK